MNTFNKTGSLEIEVTGIEFKIRKMSNHESQSNHLSFRSAATLASFRAKASLKRLNASERRARLIESSNDGDDELTGEDSSLLPRRRKAPSIPEHKEIPVASALKGIILGKKVSFLLVLMPFAYLAHRNEWNAQWIFWLNFGVMVPLAAILGDFTEEAALHTGETIGGLVSFAT